MNNQLIELEKFNTPFFLIDKKELDDSVNKLNAAFNQYWPNAIVGYSFKTNSLPWVVNYFKNKDFYAEVVSDDEYRLAEFIDFQSDKIIYNGIIKSKDTFLKAIQGGCIVNIDSEREILWLNELEQSQSYSIGIRVNFDLENFCPNQTQCGDEGGRFGFCYENGELERAINLISNYKHIRLCGLHLHCSSKTRSIDIYKAISTIACKIKKEYNLQLDYIDVGGGFFGGLKNRPQFADYLKCISEILSEEFSPFTTKLILEPGMSLIGSPISFVTSVVDIKKTNKNIFVVTDGSRNNIDPLMTKTQYFHNVLYSDDENRNREIVDKQTIVGYTCMEHDRLFELQNHQQLHVGDKIIYYKVGAYTMCLSPLFIKYFPSVYVKEKEKYFLVRKQWSEKEYVQNGMEW